MTEVLTRRLLFCAGVEGYGSEERRQNLRRIDSGKVLDKDEYEATFTTH